MLPRPLRAPHALPPPALEPAVTCSRKRCTALSMVSRPARCLRRALAAAPRAVRRPVHRRTTAADNKQQARATPETPDRVVQTWLSTMISRCPQLRERNQHAQPNSSAAKPGLDHGRFRLREGRDQPRARGERGARRCRAARAKLAEPTVKVKPGRLLGSFPASWRFKRGGAAELRVGTLGSSRAAGFPGPGPWRRLRPAHPTAPTPSQKTRPRQSPQNRPT